MLHPSCVRKAHNFNPRSHERSDTPRTTMQPSISYFNPRSHERSDNIDYQTTTVIKEISIHAPTRGATNRLAKGGSSTKFQSTLPREERPPGDKARSTGRQFQSTLPREERPPDSATDIHQGRISIHAPTRGATRQTESCTTYTKFQSTLPREERQYKDQTTVLFEKFQSTLPREERQETEEIFR